MAITKITAPLNNIQLLDKINEVIDEINNYATSKPCVSNVSVSGTTLTVTFTDNSSVTHSLQDTTYAVATTTANGLMSTSMVASLTQLGTDVAALTARVAALEPKEE